MPAGYQISQYTRPVVGKGTLVIDLPDGSSREIGITRLHLEQDAGKSLHDQHATKTYVDLNRAGVALMEIVSEPDLRSPEEAGAYLRKLRAILRYLGTCDGNMEEGSMRCDANVSVRKAGSQELGTRCEIKNVNSVRFVMQAIEYEARRQVELLEEGGKVDQETRLFDTQRGETRTMRSKEHAHDYRYFPCPDLLPLVLDGAWVDSLKANLPELPDTKKERFVRAFGMPAATASLLVAEQAVAEEAEKVIRERLKRKIPAEEAPTVYGFFDKPTQSAKLPDPLVGLITTTTVSTVNFITGPLFAIANERKEDPVDWIKKLDVVGLLNLQDEGVISGRMAKDIFSLMVHEPHKKAAAIVEEKGLRQVTNTGEIEKAVDAVLAANADKVEQVKGGNAKVVGWFVGQVMKATGGKANPGLVNEALKKKLGI
ncbi:MAG TPA: Asp-tRNA(Asn)/Glu-tRNA(Gln) amidotransferase subunit GatB [Reyranella sp.]|nr:Asp-tRNA(Asn)/Glu-tRNA(Gln) amidotransferase subunit GatB [Reyranella sp.]